MHCSTPSNCLAWAIHGAASKASSFRSTVRPIERPPNGRRAGQRYGFTSGWRMSTISKPISTAALRPSTPRSSCPPCEEECDVINLQCAERYCLRAFHGALESPALLSLCRICGDLRWRANSRCWVRNRKPHPCYAGVRRGKKHRRRGSCGHLSGIRKTNDPRSAGRFQNRRCDQPAVCGQKFRSGFCDAGSSFRARCKKGGRRNATGGPLGGSCGSYCLGWSRWNAGPKAFWDAAATPGVADGKMLCDFYFRPMTRPNEMLAAWSDAGLRSVEQASITIRFEYENFSDYWLPIAAGEASLGKFALSLAPEQWAPLEAAVRNVYLGDEPDGPRSFATTAWACKGIV